MLLVSTLFPMYWTLTLLELMMGGKVGSHCELRQNLSVLSKSKIFILKFAKC